MAIEEIINEIYEKYLNELCRIIPYHILSQISPVNKNLYNREIVPINKDSLRELEKELIMDNIHHVLAEMFYDESTCFICYDNNCSVRTDNNKKNKSKVKNINYPNNPICKKCKEKYNWFLSQESIVDKICHDYCLEEKRDKQKNKQGANYKDTLLGYVYSSRNSKKTYKTDLFIEKLKKIFEINKINYIQDDLYPFPEAFIWSNIYKKDLSKLGVMTDNDIRKICKDILNCDEKICGHFFNETYMDNNDNDTIILYYYHIEKTCRFSLISALISVIEESAVDIFTNKSNPRLNIFTKATDKQLAIFLMKVIPLCKNYTFAYSKIIDSLRKEILWNDTNFSTDSKCDNSEIRCTRDSIKNEEIIKICIHLKKLIRYDFNQLYSDKKISLLEIQQYLIDNFFYYFPSRNTPVDKIKEWENIQSNIDKAYIINITYLIYVLYGFFDNVYKMELQIKCRGDDEIIKSKSKELDIIHQIQSHLLDKYQINFPYNKIYKDYMANSSYSDEKFILINNAYNEILTNDFYNALYSLSSIYNMDDHFDEAVAETLKKYYLNKLKEENENSSVPNYSGMNFKLCK